MSNVSNVSSTNQIETEDLTINGSMSISLKFAQLQMKQAESAKKKAQDYMAKIEDSQKEQKEIADMIAKARELQNKAKAGQGDCSGDNKASYMPDDMVKFFNDHGLSYDNKGEDNRHNVEEWDYNIKSLTNYQESKSNSTQTLMVYVQDFIGQYNTYTQGAMSAISEAKQAFQAILNKV